MEVLTVESLKIDVNIVVPKSADDTYCCGWHVNNFKEASLTGQQWQRKFRFAKGKVVCSAREK